MRRAPVLILDQGVQLAPGIEAARLAVDPVDGRLYRLLDVTALPRCADEDRPAESAFASRFFATALKALASACSVNQETLLNRLRDLGDALPDVISAARDQALTDGLNRKVITTLATVLIRHAKARRATLNAAPSKSRRG